MKEPIYKCVLCSATDRRFYSHDFDIEGILCIDCMIENIRKKVREWNEIEEHYLEIRNGMERDKK